MIVQSFLILLLALVPSVRGTPWEGSPKKPLRAYCDDQIYHNHNSPTFLWHPKPYIIRYYKRCLYHDAWVRCLFRTRKNPPKNVVVQRFEKKFPDNEMEMEAAGIVFCDFQLQYVPPNITSCVYNLTMCNEVYETGDACVDSEKQVRCVWGQLSKCGVDRMWAIRQYEFGLLGSYCLRKRGRLVYPLTQAVQAGCDYDSAAQTPGPSLALSIFLCALSYLALAKTDTV